MFLCRPSFPFGHYRYPLLCLMAIFLPSIGQVRAETVMLLGCIRNETVYPQCDGVHYTLHRLMAELPEFPRTVLDTTVRVDSFPDETSLPKGRLVNAAYMLWGLVDSSGSGPVISLHILDMVQASVSHIMIMFNRTDDGTVIAETVRSKLLLWLQRTTMVQLIVTTSPAAASVLLDDRALGATPFEGMVQPGTYRLELRNRHFLPIQIPVSFISGNTYQYDFTLNTKGKKNDNRQVVRWLGISAAFLGAGGGAHWQYDRARMDYRNAVPPSDFDRLYRKTIAWKIGRDVLFAAAGTALGVMVFQVVLK